MRRTKRTAEKRWTTAAKRFWDRTLSVYAIEDEHHLALLRSACEQLSRAEQCRKVVEKQGLTFTDRYKQPKPHPLLAEERSCLNAFRLLTRELGLDTESTPEVRGPRAVGYA
jgi:phage terminase small subunit